MLVNFLLTATEFFKGTSLGLFLTCCLLLSLYFRCDCLKKFSQHMVLTRIHSYSQIILGPTIISLDKD